MQTWLHGCLRAAVCFPLVAVGCSKFAARSANQPATIRPAPNTWSTTPPPTTAPTAQTHPAGPTEKEVDAENQRLRRRITRLQNTLDESVLAHARELERELGELHADTHSPNNITRDILETTLKQRLEAKQELTTVKAKLKSMDTAAKEGKPWPEAQSDVRHDPRCLALRQRIDALEIDIAVASKEATPDKAAIEKLKRQRDAIQQKLDVVVNELTDSITDAYRQRLEERALTLDQNIFAAEQSVEQLSKRLGKVNELKSEYLSLKELEQAMREEIRSTERERTRLLEKLEAMRPTASNDGN